MATDLISVYIDNNVWDMLFALGIDLATELPKDEFCVCITREAEFEIPPISERKPELKAFIDKAIRDCSISTDSFFGFADETLPADEQRVGGFDHGRWIQPEEEVFLAQQKTPLRTLRPKTKLYKNEADWSLGARAFTGVVLSLDAKKGPINEAYKQGGRVVFLKDFPASGLSLADFIRCAISVPSS